jgi:Ig-like domain CHU_C associated/Lysyl oxidase/Secretion system C-terminal sorting domain
MKYVFSLLAALLLTWGAQAQPCTTTNAAGCGCRDGSQDCDLLPDITISWNAVLNYLNGPDEFSQNGNGIDNGRLKISGSTPNIGYGSFTVRGTNWFVCGTDTFQYTNGTPPPCAGGALPRQLLHQRVYHKTNGQMTFRDRFAGAMTYHPTHGHNHVDDWAVFTLRLRDSSQTDPRRWPIVGTGAKVGFCLMDYYSCSDPNALGQCRDSNTVFMHGTALNSTSNFRNYGLGGGQYNCSPIEQGISSGYTDMYSERLDGMWINVPPGLCNGQYWIVIEVDPHNYFQEEDETNNYTAVPYTLQRQTPAGAGAATITSSEGRLVCAGQPLTLTSSPGWRYHWSTGDTTRSIQVTQAGSYSVTVDSYCGHNTSAPMQITMAQPAPPAPTLAVGDTVCAGSAATLTAAGSATLEWLDASGNIVGTGPTFTTPALMSTATYFVKNTNLVIDSLHTTPADNTLGGGGYLASTQGLIFNADVPFNLVSCMMYAQTAGTRVIELRNDYGLTLATRTVSLPAGPSRVTLNIHVPVGRGWRLMGINANNTPLNLFRNNTGAQYPYTVPGVLSITGSTAGNTPDVFYYFFYDWKVEVVQSDCGSQPVAVAAVVGNTALSVAPVAPAYAVNAAPVTLVGTPAGGTFSGFGVVNNLFYPNVAGIGGPYTITYTYTNAQGCTSQLNVQTSVGQPTGTAEELTANGLRVAPNPARNQFGVELTVAEPAAGQLELVDLLGRTVVRQTLAPAATVRAEVPVSTLPAGPYVLKITIGGRRFVRTVVVGE